MARGYPDYGRSIGKTADGKFLQLLADPAAWFADDMEATTLKWTEDLGSVAYTTTSVSGANESEVYNKNQALKLTAAVSAAAQSKRSFGGIPETSLVSVEVMFKFPVLADYNDANNSLGLYVLDSYNGTERNRLGLAYNPNDGTWQVINSDGNWKNVTTFSIMAGSWHFARLIVNYNTEKYVELRIDNKIVDISTEPFQVSSDTSSVKSEFAIAITSANTKQAVLFVDSVKVSYGES